MTSTYPAVWGHQREAVDGSWTTTWSIELRNPLQLRRRAFEAVAVSCGDVDEGFRVHLQSLGPCCIEAIVSTRHPGMWVDYEPLTYQMFRSIEACVGEIARIQGAPRHCFPA